MKNIIVVAVAVLFFELSSSLLCEEAKIKLKKGYQRAQDHTADQMDEQKFSFMFSDSKRGTFFLLTEPKLH